MPLVRTEQAKRARRAWLIRMFMEKRLAEAKAKLKMLEPERAALSPIRSRYKALYDTYLKPLEPSLMRLKAVEDEIFKANRIVQGARDLGNVTVTHVPEGHTSKTKRAAASSPFVEKFNALTTQQQQMLLANASLFLDKSGGTKK